MLPRDTKYREAMSLDLELAQAYMDSPDFDDSPQDSRPAMSDDSQLVVLMRDVANQLRLLRSEQISVAGGNPGKVHFLQGPRTAMEIAEWQRKQRNHLSLVGRLLPHKSTEVAEKMADLAP